MVEVSSQTFEATRGRLRARFGARLEPWWEALPDVLVELAARWGLVLGEPVGRGNTSLVLAAAEAVALRSWAPSGRVPLVWGHDAAADALLLVAHLIGRLHRRRRAPWPRRDVVGGAHEVHLHPGNVLVGGLVRGLVAIDPRPCVGEAEFDAVDWVFWGVSGLLAVAQP